MANEQILSIVVFMAHSTLFGSLLESGQTGIIRHLLYGTFYTIALMNDQTKVEKWMTKTDEKSNCCLKQHYALADKHLSSS